MLNWIFKAYRPKTIAADTHLVFLQPNVRLMQWLENAVNLAALEKKPP